MSEQFDAYYTWLAIPPQEQPPNHYRLLGLALYEDNPDVIQHAADQRMGYLRTFQTGQRASFSQRLLNEVAAARLCLLHPVRKAAYDERLRETLAMQETLISDTRSDTNPDLSSSMPLAEPVEPDGAVLDEYLLLDQLGRSRTGPVFKARHRTMGRIVAIKLLSLEAMTQPDQLERFRRKIQILGQLNHPNLVTAYDAGQREGIYYLVMEYIDGQDLRALLHQYGPFPLDRAINYVAQAAAGLGYAHAQGVFHRNVKPNNLLVDRQGLVKVSGLGVARIHAGPLLTETQDLTTRGRVVGTADYMAPEQALDSHGVDGRADIYSLGCVLHTILTGQPPYPAPTPSRQLAAHREQPIPSLRARRGDVPPQLDAVFQKMLAKLPEQRFQTMQEVVTALLETAER